MLDRRLVVLVVLLAACGGPASTAAPPAATTAGSEVSRAPWSITFPNDSVLALGAGGALAIDDHGLGTLDDEGHLVRDGEVFATLHDDGTMAMGGEALAPRVDGDRLIENGVAVLEIDAEDRLHVRRPDGSELVAVPVTGATGGARRTILYLTAVYLLEVAARRADEAAADDDEEDEEVAQADDEVEDEDVEDPEDALWRMPIDDAPSQGPADALVTIVELTDFQCPYCARGAATMHAIRQRFPDDVRIVVRQRPLPFHEHARPAAEAALEARAQLGDAAFFRMMDLLFANQRSLSRGTLETLAVLVGLDLPRFRQALDGSAHEDAIVRDLALGDRMGAEGTPTFYVNGEIIVGAAPLPEFIHAVERARARARAALEAGAPREHLYETMLAHAQDPAPPPVPERVHPSAPSDVAHAPAGAHTVEGGAAFVTEHAGEGEGADRMVAARIAVWDATGLVLDGTGGSAMRLRLDSLEAPLRNALRGILPGEIRRIWLPSARVVYVEALDVE